MTDKKNILSCAVCGRELPENAEAYIAPFTISNKFFCSKKCLDDYLKIYVYKVTLTYKTPNGKLGFKSMATLAELSIEGD